MECKVMQAMSGDASAPVKVCRTPGGVWHKVESSLGGNDGTGFRGQMIYSGEFAGTVGRVQRSPARINAGGFRINLGVIETGLVRQRDVQGRVEIQVSANGPELKGIFTLHGEGLNQQVVLTGSVSDGSCNFHEPSGMSRFDGQCGPQGLRGSLKTENRMGWRTVVSIGSTMRSRQSSAEAALATAAEQQREQQRAAERAERVTHYVENLTLRAKGGDVEAMGFLGDMYSGDGEYVNDPTKSAYWYSMAAERGDPRSMLNLAINYSNGDGVSKNTTIASSLFLRCARISSKYLISCARSIGISYALGEGVPQNKKVALYWLRYCARLGDSKCDEIANQVSNSN